MRWHVRLVFALATSSCADPDFDPPLSPLHPVNQDGASHGVRFDIPFLCGEDPADLRQGVPCGATRPADDDLLSCDAAGCHGGYEFVATGPGAIRDLRGSRGPSCYTCHGREWRRVTDRPARADEEDGEDEDDGD